MTYVLCKKYNVEEIIMAIPLILSSHNHNEDKVSNEGIKSLIIGTNNTVIDDDTHIINQFAFNNLQSIKTIVIPENVYYILNYAFFSCNNLYRIMINSKDCKKDEV